MSLMRTILLATSENEWLRQRAPHWWFVKKAARRFMPGEHLDDALGAAWSLRERGIGMLLTELGENVTDARRAENVATHYEQALTVAAERGLDCQLSVKLTQLGLDVDEQVCHANLRRLAAAAQRRNTLLWIDMEQYRYVDRTLSLYRRVLSGYPNVGVCLQAYLYRTADDLRALAPLGGGVRLVKGAYREPASIAYPKRQDVDENFLRLATEMLSSAARSAGFRAVFGTHDRRILDAIARQADAANVPRDAYEFHLLFGIQVPTQQRLVQQGYRVRVLISYGDQWFAWYMRRLAERPANVLFAVRAIASS